MGAGLFFPGVGEMVSVLTNYNPSAARQAVPTQEEIEC
jgi:hypothetical protein